MYRLLSLLALLVPAQAARCLQWEPASAATSRDPLIINGKRVCAFPSEGSEAPVCTAEGECTGVVAAVDVGLSSQRGECRNGARSEESDYYVATVDLECEPQWRFLTYDVWPIGSVIVSGTTEDGHDFGVCRCPNDQGSHDIGRLYLSGSNMGGCGCFVDGKEQVIIGGYEYFQANEGKGHDFDDVVSNSNKDFDISDDKIHGAVHDLIKKHLTKEDRQMLEDITGVALDKLEEKLMEQPVDMIRKVVSFERFIKSDELNTMGLHILRCLLAERIADHRRRVRGYHKHPDYEEFMREGILTKPFDSLSEQDIKGIMMMVSGYEESELPPIKWVDRPVKHVANDSQYEMHQDTFHAAYKIWVYQEETTIDQGPLNFIKGSHKNTQGKLEWLYRVSLPPSTHILREPSVRLNTEEEKLGLPKREVMTTPAGTFVIADTSGFHARGLAEPGTFRYAMRIEGPYDGGLPRRNPFFGQ